MCVWVGVCVYIYVCVFVNFLASFEFILFYLTFNCKIDKIILSLNCKFNSCCLF